MATSTQAAAALAEIERFYKVFKAFEDAKNAVEVLSNMDQVIREQEAKKTALEDQIAVLEQKEHEWLSIIEKASADYKKLVQTGEDSAREAGRTKLAAAETKAKQLTDKAEAELEKALKERDAVQAITFTLEEKIKEQTDILNTLELKIENAKTYLQGLIK